MNLAGLSGSAIFREVDMAGRHPKGTNDADGNGAKGGSLPEKVEERVSRLEREIAAMKAIMRRNGWTLED